MTREEYKKKVDKLVKKINQTKERLYRAVDREEYEVAATLRDQIKTDQEQLKDLLSETVPTA